MSLNKEALDKLIMEVLGELSEDINIAIPVAGATIKNLEKGTPDNIASRKAIARKSDKDATKEKWKKAFGIDDFYGKFQPTPEPIPATSVDAIKAALSVAPLDKITIKDLRLNVTNGLLPKSKANMKVNDTRIPFLYYFADQGEKEAQDELNSHANTDEKAIANYGQFQKNKPKSGGWSETWLNTLNQKLQQKTPASVKDTGKRRGISDPTMITAPAERGEMLPVQFEIFNNVFGGIGDGGKDVLETRIKKLTEMTNWIMSEPPSSAPTAAGSSLFRDSKDLLTSVMVLEYFDTFMKDIDHGAGAYYFESFLAYLAGGVSGGKEKGTAGGMGESDFIMKDGSKGSAKYLQTGGSVSQNYNSFIKGQPVTYVVAYKEDASGGKTSDVEALAKVAVSVFTVERLEYGLSEAKTKARFKINGQEQDVDVSVSEGGSRTVYFTDYVTPNIVGSFMLIKTTAEQKQGLFDRVDNAIEQLGGNFKQIFDDFKGLMKLIICAKDNSKMYASSGNLEKHGNKALECLQDAEAGQEKFIQLMSQSPAQPQSNTPDSSQVNENKKNEINSLKALDKLIERVILYKNTEEK